MGIVDRIKARINEPPEDFESRAIYAWLSSLEDVTPVCSLEPRKHVRAAGVVQAIKLLPGENAPTLEVTLFDGTGEFSSVWLGRRRIPGIDLGTQMIVEGTTAGCDGLTESGRLRMINPAYELQPSTLA